jgi:hypothetical protein
MIHQRVVMPGLPAPIKIADPADYDLLPFMNQLQAQAREIVISFQLRLCTWFVFFVRLPLKIEKYFIL